MLRARVPKAREREHLRPEGLKVEVPQRRRANVEVEVAEAVEDPRLHPQRGPRT